MTYYRLRLEQVLEENGRKSGAARGKKRYWHASDAGVMCAPHAFVVLLCLFQRGELCDVCAKCISGTLLPFALPSLAYGTVFGQRYRLNLLPFRCPWTMACIV